MEKFGFVKVADGWELKLRGVARGALLFCAAVLGGFALIGLFAGATLPVKAAAVLLGGAAAAMCLRLVLYAGTSIDLRQRAFVGRALVGQRVLPFAEVGRLQPVRLTVNGAYQGIFYEAYSRAEADKKAGGIRISDTYRDEALAEECYAALQTLLR